MYITVWDADTEVQEIPFDHVDEFNIDFTDEPGTEPFVKVYNGIRGPPKTQ